MVSHKNRTRPLWITKIHKRLSINVFKRVAKDLAENHEDDIVWVLKGKPTKYAYEVTVETWGNCEFNTGERKIWVPEELAKATGENLNRFEEKNGEESEYTDENNTISSSQQQEEQEKIDKEFEEMRANESFDPYTFEEEDDNEDDIFDKFLDETMNNEPADAQV